MTGPWLTVAHNYLRAHVGKGAKFRWVLKYMHRVRVRAILLGPTILWTLVRKQNHVFMRTVNLCVHVLATNIKTLRSLEEKRPVQKRTGALQIFQQSPTRLNQHTSFFFCSVNGYKKNVLVNFLASSQ